MTIFNDYFKNSIALESRIEKNNDNTIPAEILSELSDIFKIFQDLLNGQGYTHGGHNINNTLLNIEDTYIKSMSNFFSNSFQKQVRFKSRFRFRGRVRISDTYTRYTKA